MGKKMFMISVCLVVGCFVTSSFAEKIPATKAVEQEVVTTKSELQIIDLAVGSGKEATNGDMATVHYTGWLDNGEKFDSSLDRNEPFSFRLGSGMVIKGWDEGVRTMKPGGKRKLIIPPHLGYGPRGAGRGLIPPNATLTFELELLNLR